MTIKLIVVDDGNNLFGEVFETCYDVANKNIKELFNLIDTYTKNGYECYVRQGDRLFKVTKSK